MASRSRHSPPGQGSSVFGVTTDEATSAPFPAPLPFPLIPASCPFPPSCFSPFTLPSLPIVTGVASLQLAVSLRTAIMLWLRGSERLLPAHHRSNSELCTTPF